MGSKASKPSEKTPSFQTRGASGGGGVWHSCLEEGCFHRTEVLTYLVNAELQVAFTLKKWTLGERHEKALMDALMHWRCEMMIDLLKDMLNDLSQRKNYGLVRKGLYEPLYLKVCEEWLKHRVLNVTLMGTRECGKSSIAQRWLNGECLDHHYPWIHRIFHTDVKLPDGSLVKFEIRDVSGHDDFIHFHKTWMRNAGDILVICTKISTIRVMINSFNQYLKQYYTLRKITDFTSRLNECMKWNDDQSAAVILVGTRSDKRLGDAQARIAAMKREFNLPYIECSAHEKINVDWILMSGLYECWMKEMYFRKMIQFGFTVDHTAQKGRSFVLSKSHKSIHQSDGFMLSDGSGLIHSCSDECCFPMEDDIEDTLLKPALFGKYWCHVRMGLLSSHSRICSHWLDSFRHSHLKVSIIGPPSIGKSTLILNFNGTQSATFTVDPPKTEVVVHRTLPDRSRIGFRFIEESGVPSLRDLRLEMASKKQPQIIILCATVESIDEEKEEFRVYYDQYLRGYEADCPPKELPCWILAGLKADLSALRSAARLDRINSLFPDLPYIECSSSKPDSMDVLLMSAVCECWLKDSRSG